MSDEHASESNQGLREKHHSILRLAHCREAFRSRSNAEMISKLETALQELDESLYWMELLIEAEIVTGPRLQPLMQEADELIAMAVASVRTIKRRR